MADTCPRLTGMIRHLYKTEEMMKLLGSEGFGLGVLWPLFIVVFLMACTNDENSPAAASEYEPQAGNMSSSSLSSSVASSGVESNGLSSSSVAGKNQKGLSKTVYGLAQSGFDKDSSEVRLIVLDAKSLDSTDQAFTGTLADKFGDYSLKVESLKSKYVQVSVSGEFTDGVFESRAKNDLTLNAIADVESLDTVNVNFFTHIESARVKELVRNQKVPFDEAKKKARQELLDAFNIKFVKTDSSIVDPGVPEKWSFWGNNAGDIFLMSGSILFYLHSGSDIGLFIRECTEDFSKDGKWDNDSLMYKMAKTAFEYGLDILQGDMILPSRMHRLLQPIDDWRVEYNKEVLGGRGTGAYAKNYVPDLDRNFFNLFWERTLGLGDCGKDSIGKVVKTRYGDYFTCKYDTRTNTGLRWLSSSILEANTYGIKCNSSDYFITETTDRTPRLYVCEFGKWREALDVEGKVGLCTSEKEKSLEDTDLFGYVCKSRKWEIFTDSLENQRDGKRYAYRKAAGLYWMISDLQDTTFTWAEADQCPEGWRLPTEDENFLNTPQPENNSCFLFPKVLLPQVLLLRELCLRVLRGFLCRFSELLKQVRQNSRLYSRS